MLFVMENTGACVCVGGGGGGVGSQQLLAAQVAVCEPRVVVRCGWENADGGRVAFCPYFQESWLGCRPLVQLLNR